MELYHGSYTTVEEPRVLKGRHTKDFGTGFYCTVLKQQAERWAGKFNFIRGAITREQFWVLAKFKYPTHQVAFCTKAALDCLTFKTVYSL